MSQNMKLTTTIDDNDDNNSELFNNYTHAREFRCVESWHLENSQFYMFISFCGSFGAIICRSTTSAVENINFFRVIDDGVYACHSHPSSIKNDRNLINFIDIFVCSDDPLLNTNLTTKKCITLYFCREGKRTRIFLWNLQ